MATSVSKSNKRKNRYIFYLAYLAVAVTILGLVLIMLGTVWVVLSMIRIDVSRLFTSDASERHFYFGKTLDRGTGLNITIVGAIVSLIGYFVYKFALVRIDRYNDNLAAQKEGRLLGDMKH